MKPHATNRSRAYYRHHAKRAQRRKYNIVKSKFSDRRTFSQIFDQPREYGQLKKGKIHCSCPSCSVKTKMYGMKISEMKRMGSHIDCAEWTR